MLVARTRERTRECSGPSLSTVVPRADKRRSASHPTFPLLCCCAADRTFVQDRLLRGGRTGTKLGTACWPSPFPREAPLFSNVIAAVATVPAPAAQRSLDLVDP